MQYIVLKPISPHEGPIIAPATPTADNPEPQPVIVDEELFSGDTTEERVANIARLIAAGVIAPYEELAPAPEPIAPTEHPLEAPSLPRRVARQNEE